MALQPRQFFLDVQARQFVAGANSTLPLTAPTFFEEDVEVIELYFLQPSTTPGRAYDYLDLSGATVKLAVGTVSPDALQNSWAAIPTSVTTTVTGVANGGSGSNEVQRITLSPKPTSGGFIIELPARNVSVASVTGGIFTTVNPHGLFDGQAVTLTGFTTPTGFTNGSAYYVTARTSQTFMTATTAGGTAITGFTANSGTAELAKISTGQIAYNASPVAVQNALAAVSASVSVTGVTSETYTLTFVNASGGIDFDPIVVSSSTLAASQGLRANVNFNTSEIAAAISAGNTSAILEIEVTEGSARQTFRTSATLSADLITSTSPAPVNNNTLDASWMRVEAGVTGLQGGSSSNLDGLLTADGTYPVNICVFFIENGTPAIWQLTSGTQATDLSNGILRPLDYASTTNEKVWIQRM